MLSMTIYALSTGPGVSGVAIVRISGEDASKVIKLFDWAKFTQAKSGIIEKNQ